MLRWEFPVAHALSSYVSGCYAAFEFFWTSLLRRRELTCRELPSRTSPLARQQMWVLGYSLFIWATMGDWFN